MEKISDFFLTLIDSCDILYHIENKGERNHGEID